MSTNKPGPRGKLDLPSAKIIRDTARGPESKSNIPDFSSPGRERRFDIDKEEEEEEHRREENTQEMV